MWNKSPARPNMLKRNQLRYVEIRKSFGEEIASLAVKLVTQVIEKVNTREVFLNVEYERPGGITLGPAIGFNICYYDIIVVVHINGEVSYQKWIESHTMPSGWSKELPLTNLNDPKSIDIILEQFKSEGEKDGNVQSNP